MIEREKNKERKMRCFKSICTISGSCIIEIESKENYFHVHHIFRKHQQFVAILE